MQVGAGGNNWGVFGNAGTVDNTNFIGTTDNVPFNIRVNNQKAGRIDSTIFTTFFGYQAGNFSTGTRNTANGFQALFSNTTGAQNTAIGNQSLLKNTTGSRNTATGSQALKKNTTGFRNTAFGDSTLFTNTIGSLNTAIGYLADVVDNNLTNATAIGAGALVLASNTIQLGNSTVTDVQTFGTITTTKGVVANGYTTAVKITNIDYTLTPDDDIVSASGSIFIYLPTAVGIKGRKYTIINSGSATVKIISSETINGIAAIYYPLNNQYQYITVVSDGVRWLIVANN